MEEPQRKQIESQQGLTIVTSKYAVKCKLCISYIKKTTVKFCLAATSPSFCKAVGALLIPSAGTPRFPSALHSAARCPTLRSSLAWWSRFFSVFPRHPCAPLTPFTHLSSSSCLILPLDCTPGFALVSPGFAPAVAGQVGGIQEELKGASHCLAYTPDSFSEIHDLCISLLWQHSLLRIDGERPPGSLCPLRNPDAFTHTPGWRSKLRHSRYPPAGTCISFHTGISDIPAWIFGEIIKQCSFLESTKFLG